MVLNMLHMTENDTDYVMLTGEWLDDIDTHYVNDVLAIQCTFAPFTLEMTASGRWYICGAGHDDYYGVNGAAAVREFFNMCNHERHYMFHVENGHDVVTKQ